MADLYGPQQLLHDGSAAAGAGLRSSGIPPSVSRHRAAGGLLSAPGRLRPRPRGPDGDGGSSTRAVRRRPAPATRSRTASPSRGCSPTRFAICTSTCWRRSSGRCRRRCSPARPRTASAPHIVLLTPGPLQRDLFRARLPRALSRLHARRRQRPDGARRSRLPQDRQRSASRVHGILRRLDDDFCDPLELRADSALGVPGLVQAWRAGDVLVANALRRGRARVAGAARVSAGASRAAARRDR